MASEGSSWSPEELNSLVDIWTEDRNPENMEDFGKIRDFLASRGYQRTAKQCRDKIEELIALYQKTREEAVLDVINQVMEEYGFPREGPSTDHSSGTPPNGKFIQLILVVQSSCSQCPLHHLWVYEHAVMMKPHCCRVPTSAVPTRKRKRRERRSDLRDVMKELLDLQRRQHEENMKAAQRRHECMMDMWSRWMTQLREIQERQLQLITMSMQMRPHQDSV